MSLRTHFLVGKRKRIALVAPRLKDLLPLFRVIHELPKVERIELRQITWFAEVAENGELVELLKYELGGDQPGMELRVVENSSISGLRDRWIRTTQNRVRAMAQD